MERLRNRQTLMSDNAVPKNLSNGSAFKCAFIWFIAVPIAFLLGIIPLWRKASRSEQADDIARVPLHGREIDGALKSVAVDARRSAYECAPQAVSPFLSSLSAASNASGASALAVDRRLSLSSIFSRRRPVVTSPACSGPAFEDCLSNPHLTFLESIGQ